MESDLHGVQLHTTFLLLNFVKTKFCPEILILLNKRHTHNLVVSATPGYTELMLHGNINCAWCLGYSFFIFSELSMVPCQPNDFFVKYEAF